MNGSGGGALRPPLRPRFSSLLFSLTRKAAETSKKHRASVSTTAVGAILNPHSKLLFELGIVQCCLGLFLALLFNLLLTTSIRRPILTFAALLSFVGRWGDG